MTAGQSPADLHGVPVAGAVSRIVRSARTSNFRSKIRNIDPAGTQRTGVAVDDAAAPAGELLQQSVTKCSGGERSALLCARWPMTRDILFFDDPLRHRLQVAQDVGKELKDIHRETGKTFIYITHSAWRRRW